MPIPDRRRTNTRAKNPNRYGARPANSDPLKRDNTGEGLPPATPAPAKRQRCMLEVSHGRGADASAGTGTRLHIGQSQGTSMMAMQ